MSENLKPFKAQKFCNKMIARGHDCFIHTIGGEYKNKSGHLKGKDWEKDTVYMKKEDGRFLEYVNTSTGSWYEVTNPTLLKTFQLYP